MVIRAEMRRIKRGVEGGRHNTPGNKDNTWAPKAEEMLHSQTAENAKRARVPRGSTRGTTGTPCRAD